MTNYIVSSPQTLLTGTTGNDLFQLTTGLAVSVFGVEGADEFSATNDARNFTQAILNGGSGNDTIRLEGGAADESATLLSLIGGGGSDAISGVLSATADRLLIQGGGDNDTIDFLLSGDANTAVTINGNGGNDSFAITAGVLTNSLVALGGGNDLGSAFVLSGFGSSTLIGGGGNDLISATLIAGSNLVIAGDTNSELGEYDGNDTITIASGSSISDSLIQGNGGNDAINLTGLGGGNIVAGNSGNDTITLDAIIDATRTQVNGGAGNDVISATYSGAGSQDLSIFGGGGNDTITVSASAVNTNTSYIIGGAGADIINLIGSGASDATTLIEVAYTNASESNLSNLDSISAGIATGGYNVASLYQSVTLGVATSQGTNVVAAATGQVTFSNTFALGVTARAEGIDALGTEKGSTYYFADGLGSQYLFVQGGSSGLSDDLIVKNATGTIDGLTVAARGAGLVGGTIAVSLTN